MLVVVADVGREDSFEVPSVHDQDPVEELAPYGADEHFSVYGISDNSLINEDKPE
jgi:hypothetical protein